MGGAKRAFELTLNMQTSVNNLKHQFLQFNLTKEKLATMAAKIYAAESSVYRTVGLFEERMGQLSEEQQKDGK